MLIFQHRRCFVKGFVCTGRSAHHLHLFDVSAPRYVVSVSSSRARQILAIPPIAEAARTESPNRVVFRSGSNFFVLPFEQVDAITGAGNYATVLAGDREILVRERLADMTARLQEHGFARLDRSTIVNLLNVREVRRQSRTMFALTFASGRKITISDSCRSRLEALIPGF